MAMPEKTEKHEVKLSQVVFTQNQRVPSRKKREDGVYEAGKLTTSMTIAEFDLRLIDGWVWARCRVAPASDPGEVRAYGPGIVGSVVIAQ